ncbi:MAG: FHA domain-containing protein [Myxococcales bacterium]|nr:FHA domain-containing protein [Myxococcales bacterium]
MGIPGTPGTMGMMMMMMGTSTKTDAAANEWLIDDSVFRLRLWGTDTIRPLPAPPIHECTVGAAETCLLRLDDPSGRISRLHARLIREETRWLLRDLGSKNGVRLDGARRTEIVLEPGIEIGIGGLTLIAESGRSVALRSFLARGLGWRSDRIETVDHALRSIRMAAARRVALVLSGDGDLVPTARSIHRHALGADRPFVVCDPRRRQGKATVRSAENYETGMQAYAAATGGSLCVRNRRLPRDFDDVVIALRDPSSRVQLVVCADEVGDAGPYLAAPIIVPSLATRVAEIDRIITEYAEDAIAELGTPRTGFLAVDRAWVREHASSSLPEIEKATLRLVAIRESRNLSNAAARLGMAPVSLSRWIGRRSLPMQIVS